MLKFKKEKKTAVADDTVQLVTFLVGAEEYGLDINAITEVVRPLKITPLPRMPEFIEGVVNLRGIIIPVVDLRKRFGLAAGEDNPKKMRMLITRGAVHGPSKQSAGLLGLVVDGVQEVLYIPQTDVDRAPEAARGQQAEFIRGVAKASGKLVIVIDIKAILSRQERAALAEAGDAEP